MMKSCESPLITGDDLPLRLISGVIGTLAPPVLHGADLNRLTRQVLGSFELSMAKKNRVFEAVPRLCIYQFDTLDQTFVDERQDFEQRLQKEANLILRLNARALFGAFSLACLRGAGYRDKDAEIAVLRRMVRHKAEHTPLRKLLDSLNDDEWTAPMRFVYAPALHPDGPHGKSPSHETPAYL